MKRIALLFADGGLLVAPDKESWQELRRELWAE